MRVSPHAPQFALAKPPKAWLSWEGCQLARVHAERAVAEATDPAEARAHVRSCCLLTILTALPPDRVGVYRKLQLGTTLKRAVCGGGWQIDLATRDAHSARWRGF